MSKNVERLARRAQHDPFFLASPLQRYAAVRQLDDAALAGRLGCDAGALVHLRLCRNPNPEPPHFWNDVARIAAHFRLDANRLAEIIREGQGLLLLPPAVEQKDDAPGYLMAARQDDEEEGGGES